MVIPCELVLLLERLFAKKIGNELVEPLFAERVEIYHKALEFALKDPRLLLYVERHQNLVWKPNEQSEYMLAAE